MGIDRKKLDKYRVTQRQNGPFLTFATLIFREFFINLLLSNEKFDLSHKKHVILAKAILCTHINCVV